MKKKNIIATLTIAASLVNFGPAQDAAADADYEGGRGLITLEGPSGLFINPTSGTLPKNVGTAQYCFFLPNNETDVVGHGAIASYAFEDWLEFGAQANFIDDAKDKTAIGPNMRARIAQDDGEWVPELSLGAYSRFGDDLDKLGAYAAAFRRFELSDDGAVRSIGTHAGVKYVDIDNVDGDTSVYGGLELEMPNHLYLVGEVATESDLESKTPYSFGLQWRAYGINISLAGIQNGGVDDPSFYFGIGHARDF